MEARRKCDENPKSSVVAYAIKLPANSCYGYQITDRRQHTVTKYLSVEKTQAASNNKVFQKLDHVKNSLNEVQLAKAKIEHKEPIIVGFHNVQNAQVRNLELFFKIFTKFCVVIKLQELEMDKYSLYIAPAERELEDCVQLGGKTDWKRMLSKGCKTFQKT